MLTIEGRNCVVLLSYWDKIPVEGVNLAECDRYHDWRVAKIKRRKGHRAVDLDLNNLSNAFTWASRCELVKANPLSTRPRYCADKFVKHCRDFMPVDANDLHRLASLFFSNPRSEVLGWQLLFEAVTGLRTCEVLRMRWDAQPYQPGWITADGKSLCVGTLAEQGRAKKQHAVNPFVNIHEGLKATLDALLLWKTKRFPESPWFFPSTEYPMKPVGGTALAHALLRVSPQLGHKVTSHGMRAFYVLVRRSHGISDVQIAYEIGHTTGGATIAAVYGGCPPEWMLGGGPKMTWLPSGEPAWKALDLKP
jgi:integrase